MFKSELKKLIPLTSDGYINAQLKVSENGGDITPGEYIISGEQGFVTIYITSTPWAGDNINDGKVMVHFNQNEYRHYVIVEEGQYILFYGGRLYKSGDAPPVLKTADGYFTPGQYKVGTDLKPGRYKIRKKTESTYLSYSLYKNLPFNSRNGYMLFENRIFDFSGVADGTEIVIDAPPDGENRYFSLGKGYLEFLY